MSSNVEAGTGDRASEFVRTLGKLKTTGCNLLLVGQVPDDVLAAASRKLLGDPTQHRLRLFVFTDPERTSVQERLPGVDSLTHPVDATVVTHAGAARTPAVEVDGLLPTTWVAVNGSLPELAATIHEEIAAIDSAADGLEPAQLRLCFDSLIPLLVDYDVQEVEAFLGEVTERILDVNGMAHYVLPFERDHPMVAQLDSQFAATIEYRTAEGGQERWHFPRTDFTTGWFPLR